jgi:hypothetical protein
VHQGLAHVFNLLDARGVISVTERQSYILRVRDARPRLRRGLAEDRRRGSELMPELLLELFSEEIPGAHAAPGGGRSEGARHRRARRRVASTYENAVAYVTPRRLALRVIAGVPVRSKRRRARSARARASARPMQAVAGFLKAAGLSSLDEAEIVADPKKGEFYVARIQEGGPRGDGACDGRDRARRGAGLPVAEVDALGRRLGGGRRAALGPPAALDPLHLRRRRPRSPTW